MRKICKKMILLGDASVINPHLLNTKIDKPGSYSVTSFIKMTDLLLQSGGKIKRLGYSSMKTLP